MPQEKNKRVQRTIYALQQALVQLTKQKSKHHISVRELCETAGVNRSTFYVYYKDIDELMEEIEQEVYAQIEIALDTEPSGFLQMLRTMEYIRKNQDVVLMMLQQDNSNALECFSDIMWRKFDMAYQRMNRCRDIPQAKYLYVMLFTGTLGVIRKWLENGCVEPAEQIARIIWETVLFCESQKNFGNTIAF